MIHAPLQVPARATVTAPVRCALDRHLGPFEEIPELAGWLGADWCQCRACRSTMTVRTAHRQKHAA